MEHKLTAVKNEWNSTPENLDSLFLEAIFLIKLTLIIQ